MGKLVAVAAFATGLCCGQILTSFGVVLPEKSALCSLASLGPFAVSTPEALGIPRPLSNYLAPNNTPTPLTATFEQGFGTAIACTTHSSGTSIVGSISKLDLLPWSTFVVCFRQKTYTRNQGKTEGRQKPFLFCASFWRNRDGGNRDGRDRDQLGASLADPIMEAVECRPAKSQLCVAPHVVFDSANGLNALGSCRCPKKTSLGQGTLCSPNALPGCWGNRGSTSKGIEPKGALTPPMLCQCIGDTKRLP